MTPEIVIYHHAGCSKSRAALAELTERGYQLRVVEYVKNPLGEHEIRQLLTRLGIAASSLIRASDFHRLGLTATDANDALIALIAKHPILMERPIIVVGQRAVIARPVERMYDILPSASSDDGAEGGAARAST